ncbi:MAG: kynureninase/PvdN C-terminal domain-containing protein [Acidobacteriota bacterium]
MNQSVDESSVDESPVGAHSVDLARHYSRFRVAERLLLTGHSHQAWPDVAFEAQQQAWLDAAAMVDDKWVRAAEIADEVRTGWRRLLNDFKGEIALGQNTHELVTRLLSAVLPTFSTARAPAEGVRRRTRLVTTSGEFHTVRRQLDRLSEEGIDVVKVAASPVETLAERLSSAIDDHTACVIVSSVLFETAEIVPGLDLLAARSARHGAALLIDTYHHLNVVPFDLAAMGLEAAFIVGGGYKYCQLGEGNCFLRLPAGCTLRPVLTGWFSEFAELADGREPGAVRYGQGPARFAGATYDVTPHYRAAAVFRFHQEMALIPETLRAISQRQVSTLEAGVRRLAVDPALLAPMEVPPDRRGGFLALRSPHAATLVARLRARGVWTDARGDVLRLGPAPYVSDEQLASSLERIEEALRSLLLERG